MENRKFTVTTRQLIAIVSSFVAIMGGEIAIGTELMSSKASFREEIANQIHYSKDTIPIIVSAIIQDEMNRTFVGFFLDREKYLVFRHTDGRDYVPIIDSVSGRYFIILTSGERVFCY